MTKADVEKLIADDDGGSGSNLDRCDPDLIQIDPVNEPLKTVVLRLIREQPGVSRPTLAKLTGKSRATITRILSSLQGSNLIEHRGSDKTGGYYAKGGQQ